MLEPEYLSEQYGITDDSAVAVLNQFEDEKAALNALVEKHNQITKTTAEDVEWWKKYGVSDEGWLNIVSRYKTPRDAIDGLVEKHKQISSSISAPSKDLESDEYSQKVSEMRRKVIGVEKAEDYVVNIPDDLKEEVLKRKENFEKEVREKAFEYARTQAEVDADVDDAMTKLREVITKEKEVENTANATKVRHRQELENIWGKRTDEEVEKGRLVLRHYDNTLFFGDNQNLYPEEVIAEKGGFLEQFFAEHDHPVLRRWLSGLHNKILAEGELVGGTKTGTAGSLYKERYEKAKAANPKRPEEYGMNSLRAQ